MEGPVEWRGRSGGGAGRVEGLVGWRGQSGGVCVCVCVCGPAYVRTGTCVDWHITRRSAAAAGNLT